MALLFMDGFDAGDYAIKWTNGFGSLQVDTRFGIGRSIAPSSTISKSITPSAQVTIVTALKPGNAFQISMGGDSGATLHLLLSRNASTGQLELYRNFTLIATGTLNLLVGVWYYIEFQATINDTTGTGIVRINGDTNPDINFTGDTRNGGTSTNIDAVAIWTSSTTYFDDFYVLNSTGSVNNTFLGDVRIHSLSPNGNGASSTLTGSDGNQVNNFQQVDELPYDTADYNGSPNTGDRDTYTMTDLPAGASSVLAVQNNIIAAKSDATLASAKSVLRTGGTNYYGTTQALASSYVDYYQIYETNPNTTIAWTISDVNGLESGMEVA